MRTQRQITDMKGLPILISNSYAKKNRQLSAFICCSVMKKPTLGGFFHGHLDAINYLLNLLITKARSVVVGWLGLASQSQLAG